MPTVSVVMPVFNGERFLRLAVDSVLAQTFSDFELLVVNDGSSDGTTDILRSYNDPRLRTFELDHLGVVGARNHGVSQSHAEWIACLDADDISLPHRLATQLAALRRHPGASFTYSDAEFFGDASLMLRPARLPRTPALLAMKFCFYCPIIASTVMFNRNASLKVGSYHPDEPYAEDFGLWGRLLELGPSVAVNERLVRYRFHEQSVTKQKFEIQSAASERIASRHCRRFLNLDEPTAQRVQALLRAGPAGCSPNGWFWFLFRCAPRLRWKSPELFAWLARETLRVVIRRR